MNTSTSATRDSGPSRTRHRLGARDGRAIAESLPSEGCSVVIRDLDEETLSETATELREEGDVVAFLATERASYVSGANYRVDGGSIASIDV